MDYEPCTGRNSLDNPWPVIQDSIDNEISNCFDDNFNTELTNSKSNGEINKNGLKLPDSEQYLNTLENKLLRLKVPASVGVKSNANQKSALNRAMVKEMLKSLALKRDEAFQHDTDMSDSNLFHSEGSDSDFKKLSSAITNSAIFNTIEKKLFPHLQALDEEELKTLINSDLLDTICNLNLTIDDNEKKSDTNDTSKDCNEATKDDKLE